MTRPNTLRLGVNIDHVATVRNARGGDNPDPVRAALLAIEAGADGITAHLREDRRHITDDDIAQLKARISKPLNFEMAATSEMVAIALRTKPHACCLVPEKRKERTTEGGLDVVRLAPVLQPIVKELTANGSRVSLFIEPDPAAIDTAVRLGAPVVELHTGTYCHAVAAGEDGAAARELDRIVAAARHGARAGIEVHAGHGLTFGSVKPIAAIPQIVELNIGHFLVGEAIFMGFVAAIRRMRTLMNEARAQAGSHS